ncbi:MAG: sulfotransferase family 2 domain-containing protein [Pseudomonadota bacterium]
MSNVISIFWPQADAATPGRVPRDVGALLSRITDITGLEISAASFDMDDDAAVKDLPADQRFLIIHPSFVEGVILAFENAVARGLEDSADSFSIFASQQFAKFLEFRKRWIAGDVAAKHPRLNMSNLRINPSNALTSIFKSLTRDMPKPYEPDAENIQALTALCQPLLDMTAPKSFRYYDEKLFETLRNIKLPRAVVARSFQNLMGRRPSDEQILFFQTLPSVKRLEESLMSSQEYLTRFGLSEDDIRISYQVFLNRLPSASEVEQMKKTHPDLASLRKVFLKSSEFSRQYAQFIGSGNSVMSGMAGAEAANAPIPFKSAPNLRSCDTDRVVFLHIPKCGGTTLHNMLQQWFKAENVHPERFNGLYGYTGASLASSLVFSGHYDYYSTTLIPGPKKLISFLRDPLDRLVSLYNFHRAHSPTIIERNNLQLPRWANENDIDAYFAHPTIRVHPAINNSIVRYFSDIPQIARSHRSSQMDGIKLDDMLEQALKNLKKFAFVGFMDRYDTDMDRLADTLQRDRPAEVRKHQVLDDLMKSNPDMRKIEKQKPNAASREAMEELVSYDRIFYAQARELFS